MCNGKEYDLLFQQTENTLLAQHKELDTALAVLDQNGVLHIVPAWFHKALQDDIRRRVVGDFWRHFDQPTEDGQGGLSAQFTTAVDYLHGVTQGYAACLSIIKNIQHSLSMKTIADDDGGGGGKERGWRDRGQGGAAWKGWLEDHLVLLLKSFLFSTFPKHFREAVQLFYSQVFTLFRRGKPV